MNIRDELDDFINQTKEEKNNKSLGGKNDFVGKILP